MKVSVNLDLCQGHGQCEDAAPEVFHVSDEGLAVVLIAEPGEEYRTRILDAKRRCPPDAISIEG